MGKHGRHPLRVKLKMKFLFYLCITFRTGIGILQKLQQNSQEVERQEYIKQSIRLIQHSVTNNARTTLRNNRKTNLRFSVKPWGARNFFFNLLLFVDFKKKKHFNGFFWNIK